MEEDSGGEMTSMRKHLGKFLDQRINGTSDAYEKTMNLEVVALGEKQRLLKVNAERRMSTCNKLKAYELVLHRYDSSIKEQYVIKIWFSIILYYQLEQLRKCEDVDNFRNLATEITAMQ
ncbi:hypothetical protein TNCV_1305391 [Trichonephila clavipes]|nr:hypothetical protein TNCV_1305391 [Trichonephila clavipes]